MRLRRSALLAIIPVSLACSPPPPSGATGNADDGRVAAFVGARIIDGTGRSPVEDGVLIVREGRIEAVGPAADHPPPAGARRVDLRGKTLMPGMINAHGHVNNVRGLQSGPELYTRDNITRQLRVYARYGVTTVFSLGDDGAAGVEVRDAQPMNTVDMARLFLAGPVVSATDPRAARRAVDEVAGMKADIVKIRVDDNLGTSAKMPPTAYKAVIDQAHQHGLEVAAHIFYLQDAKDLLAAGADYIAHSVRDVAVDDALIGLLKARDICVCPTLMREVSTFVYESRPAFFDDPFFQREVEPSTIEGLEAAEYQTSIRNDAAAQQYKEALDVAQANLKRLTDAGVRIAFGTDTGPPGRFQGYFEHLELERMVEAGLTPMQALVAATGDAARCMNIGDRVGTLEPGLEADFLVLERNPLEDIRHTRTLESVWIRGSLGNKREQAKD
ncbi:MAG: amidohydrolase family protein [Luteitalea sp.]|nr:amidohydrolase family protein [Luteitalea sp.]